ncbi:MAG: hypothetical protein HKN63_05010 [Rhodobacteraceae bacterium]|nr:hypothetical protein [Paracoccaceae bacterium]
MKRLALALMAVFVAACEPSDLRPVAAPAEQLIARGDYLGAVQYYRQALQTNPDDADLRRGYLAVAERSVGYFAGEARRRADLGDFGTAEQLVGQGLVAVPDSVVLAELREEIRDRRRARQVYNEAFAAARLGRTGQALGKVEEALSLDPNYADALRLFARLNEEAALDQTVEPIRLRTGAAVTVNFRNAGFKEALLALGQAYGVNMIFDSGVEDRQITLFAEDVSFTQAFELLLKTNRAFYRRLGKNSVVIAPDTPEGRAAYEDYLVRTFYLESINAAVAADLVSRSLGIANVTVSEEGNSITVRENRERLSLVAQLLANNDRTPAEVVIEVEILQIDRTKSEQLGLDLGSQITLTPPSVTLGDLNSSESRQSALNASVLSLPAATFRFFKQDVDAKTLASPRIRTLDKQDALIHIGDRVPLRSSTIQDATGQTRTTFEYRDVGIKLNVTPEIKLDRSVVVDLELEISSLGQNLGTADEPAFAIGTRNVGTRMALDDGETAVIGGLIRDEERDTRQAVPGLGDIPAAGRIFRSRDGQGLRTDILLTLTPRIIRAKDVPSTAEAQFFSGSGDRVSLQRTRDFLARGGGDAPTIRLDLSGSGASPLAGVTAPSAPLAGLGRSTSPNAPLTAGSDAVLAFARSSYEVAPEETVGTTITAAGFDDLVSGTATIRFRADLVEAVSVSTPSNLPFEIDNSRGEIKLTLNSGIAGAAVREIAMVSFRGLKPGLSYLIFSSDFGSNPNVKVPDGLELRSSRIAVK